MGCCESCFGFVRRFQYSRINNNDTITPPSKKKLELSSPSRLFHPKRRIEHYYEFDKSVDVLGTGGYAVVRLGYNKFNKKRVAIKVYFYVLYMYISN
jgi:hypothetical protein